MGLRPGTPKSPNSGRKRGGIDRAQRLLLTEKMAGDIMRVYQRLGGVKWLLDFAKENPAEFLRQGLSRLFPAPIKEDPDFQLNQQFNIDSGNTTEIARRVAFALAAGLSAQEREQEVEQRVPYVEMAREEDTDPFHYPTPAPDPERERWAKEASMTPEERLNAESLDEHCNRKAFADRPPRPAWMPSEDRPARTPVRLRTKRDLL